MQSTRKEVRIISLGEIVTLDIMKTLIAFTELIVKKIESNNPEEIGNKIGAILQEKVNFINEFKMGKFTESEFTNQMILTFKDVTGAQITVEEFDNAWSKKDSSFKQFSAALNQAIDYNNKTNQEIIFISFTNPKDIRNLANELKINDKKFTYDGNTITNIEGIPLYTTYSAQQSKAELIVNTIKELNNKSPINNLSFISEQSNMPSPNIKYIRGVNNINDPILKEDLDKTNQEIEKKTDQYFVDTIIWMKSEQSLSGVLANTEMTSRLISASKL